MVFHRADPAHFDGPGGTEEDPVAFRKAVLRAEVEELIRQHCLEHSAKIADAVLDAYSLTRRRRRYL